MKFVFVPTLVVILLLQGPNLANADLFTLSGTMDPAQALTNPGNVGGGTGVIVGTYDDVTNLLNYNISWSGLTSTVTNMHFHLGAPGVSGGVVLAIPGNPWVSPTIGTDILLDDLTQEMDLLAGDWYVNIHTTNFGGGEIRGQVNIAPVPEPGTAVFGLIGLAGFYLRRRPVA